MKEISDINSPLGRVAPENPGPRLTFVNCGNFFFFKNICYLGSIDMFYLNSKTQIISV